MWNRLSTWLNFGTQRQRFVKEALFTALLVCVVSAFKHYLGIHFKWAGYQDKPFAFLRTLLATFIGTLVGMNAVRLFNARSRFIR